MAEYTIHVNSQEVKVSADPDTPLLWVLRDQLNLKGTKYGCGIAVCGSCTVHLDGVAMRSCTVPISVVYNQKITTIEGLDPEGKHPLQEAWREHDVPQCGYCQAGQIMTAAALLNNTRRPTDPQIDDAMSVNICRCATYLRIKRAIKSAAQNI